MPRETRRQWLATTAGTAAALPLLAGCMGSSDDDDDEADDTNDSSTDSTEENGLGVATGDSTWPMADFDAANTKVVEDRDGPEGPVEERWAVEMDDDLSEPVVAHGLVYVMEAGATLYAFDLATGDIEWERDRDGHDRTATPAVTDDTVYFLTDELEALNPETGDQQWSIDLPGGSSNGQIRVFDGTVYAAAGGHVSAIDVNEEELVWSEEASDHRDIAIDGDGHVYVSRELVEREDWRWDSFDGDSGDHRWEYEPDEEIGTPRSGVVIYDEKLYSLANEDLLEFDTESGDVEVLFEYRNLTGPGRPVIVNDIAITSTDGTLVEPPVNSYPVGHPIEDRPAQRCQSKIQVTQ